MLAHVIYSPLSMLLAIDSWALPESLMHTPSRPETLSMVRANLRIVWFILSSNAHAFEARDPDDGPGRPSDRVISSLLDVHASEARNFWFVESSFFPGG